MPKATNSQTCNLFKIWKFTQPMYIVYYYHYYRFELKKFDYIYHIPVSAGVENTQSMHYSILVNCDDAAPCEDVTIGGLYIGMLIRE